MNNEQFKISLSSSPSEARLRVEDQLPLWQRGRGFFTPFGKGGMKRGILLLSSLFIFSSSAQAATIMRPPNHLGLVGHWELTSGSLKNGKAQDTASSINDGTISGTVDMRNHGYKFDGVDDYIKIGDKSELESMGVLSVSAWIKTTTTATNKGIVAKWYTGTVSYSLRTSVNSPGKIDFHTQTSATTTSTSTSSINDGSWHHLVGIYDGTTQKLYIDGIEEDSDSQTGTIKDSEEEFCIGTFCNGTTTDGFFDGNIADVRVYNYALSTAEILDLNNNKNAGISVGHWPLNRNTQDVSGNGNHGTPLPDNKGPYYTTGPQSQANGAMVFDGSDDYVQTTNPLFSGNDNFTFSGWVKLGNLTNVHRFFSQGNESANSHFWVGADATTGYFQWGFWANDKTTTTALSADTWYHIVVVKDGATSYGYVNGTQIDSLASGTLTIGNNAAYLGAISASHPHRLAGNLADVRIYNSALTSTDITNLYNGQSVGTPVGHWLLNGNIQDSSSNANHGIVNAMKFYDGPLSIGDSAYFNGASSISINSNSSAKPTGSQTFSFWYNTDTHFPVNWMQIFGGVSFSGSANVGHAFGITRQDLGGAIVSDLHNAATTGEKRSMGWIGYPGEGWHFVTSIYDRSAPRHIVYIDGVKVIDKYPGNATNWDSGYLDVSWGSTPLRIGSNSAGTGWFYSGYLRDFKIYNRTLSQAEILRMYTASETTGSASTVKPPSRTGLVGNWKLSQSGQEGGAELNVNWDMETGVTSTWSWDPKANGIRSEYTVDKYRGSKSAKLTNATDSSIAFWQQRTGVTVGTYFRVGVWAKNVDCPTTPYWGNTGATLVSSNTGSASFTGISTTEWKYYTALFKATASTVDIHVRTANNATQGSFLIDDFTFKVVQEGDASGNGNNGIIYNGVVYATGPHGESGGAMDFDGTDDAVSITNIPASEIVSSTGTYSYWLKLDTTNSHHGPFHWYDSGGVGTADYIRNYISAANNQIDLIIEDEDVVKVSLAYDLDNLGSYVGQWHHFVWRQDGGADGDGIDLFIDGQEKTLSGTNSTDWWTSHLIEGTNVIRMGLSWYYLDGKMSDVRIYNRPLSGSEIAGLYRSSKPATINSSQNDKVTSGLVGLWSFNGPDVNGTVAYDQSGNGNNGTITGAVPAIGKVGQGMSFDGNDVVSCGTDVTYAFGSGDHSFAAWVNPSALETSSVYNYIVAVGNGSAGQQSGFGVKNTASGGNFFHSAYSSPLITFSDTIPLDEWSHVALVHQSGTSKLYINGVWKEDKAITMNVQTGKCYIGTHTGGSSYFDEGVLDEVRIYNRALSATEITQLYNLGR